MYYFFFHPLTAHVGLISFSITSHHFAKMAGLLPDSVHPQRSKYFQTYIEMPDDTGKKKKVLKKEEKEQERIQKQAPPVQPPDAIIEPKPTATV